MDPARQTPRHPHVLRTTDNRPDGQRVNEEKNKPLSNIHKEGSSCCGSLVSMRMQVRSLALCSGLRIGHCRELGVGRRCALDLVWLWLWRRLAVTALIRPLAWDPPYPVGVALKRLNKQTKNTSQGSRTGKSQRQNTDWWWRGLGEERWGGSANGYRVSFWVDENVLELDCGGGGTF